MMRSLLLIALVGIVIISCNYMPSNGSSEGIETKNSEKLELKASEKDIVKTLGMNDDLAILLKSFSNTKKIHPLSASESIWPTPSFSGISISLSMEQADKLIDYYPLFKENGFLLFRSEMNFGLELDEISVIKSKDQYDILRYSGTDGINYDILPDDIIKKLKLWEEKYPFQIEGADLDWISAKFLNNDLDLSELSKEIYEFCPDVVDQGTGTIKELENEMEHNGFLYLWWD